MRALSVTSALLFVLTSGTMSVVAENLAATGTLGAPPPTGAIMLFDGTNQDAWLSQMDRRWEETDRAADWKITPEGWLEVVPGAGSLITKQRWRDFQLHYEFCLPPSEVNGGVFLLARYELGISASSDGRSRCGGVDNLRERIRPTVKADLGPNDWQSVDVEFRAPRFDDANKVTENARATVLFNGVMIHDNVELGPRKGAAKRLGDSPDGPIMLQDHGSTHWFRNIWIVERQVAAN